ncbi:MAG: type VI secretion system baseplate subunit TssF [Pseudomonadota bacterium]
MDRAFLAYYEEELTHIRELAGEFAAIHPNVARNLSIDSTPCPDPYVERLLEGVAFLGARTRLKVDGEASRYVRNLLDTLYPDLAGPAPAMSMARLAPGPQVDSMVGGHEVAAGTRLISGLRDGLRTRSTFTTAQAVHLWPLEISAVDYLQDPGALREAGISDQQSGQAQAGLRFELTRTGPGLMSDLTLDSLDVYFGKSSRAAAVFDAIFGVGHTALCRPGDRNARYMPAEPPELVGVNDAEALTPKLRHAFEGYRLLREYFLMPERFHYVRLGGLSGAVSTAKGTKIEVVILLDREQPALGDLKPADVQLFTTPVVNLFERECNLVQLDPQKSAHIVHADRTRPRDYEIYRLLRVEDAENSGPQARITPIFSLEQRSDSGHVYSVERRPRRPGEDEIRRGQTRTSYIGDDLFISVSHPDGMADQKGLKRLDIRALCTNRDLPILDDNPVLTLETGDPVGEVQLLSAFKRPRPSLRSALPTGSGSERKMDDLTWRWISQLSLNHISLAAEGKDSEPLRALLMLYADRGDPKLERHGRSVRRVTSAPVIERIQRPGPICFGHGVEITLEIDETVLSGHSNLLLSALLSRLFARHVGINSFARTRTQLTQQQQEIEWPMTPGTRSLI